MMIRDITDIQTLLNLDDKTELDIFHNTGDEVDIIGGLTYQDGKIVMNITITPNS